MLALYRINMDIIGIYSLHENLGMACGIGIDFFGFNAVKCDKVPMCFKPFAFLLCKTQSNVACTCIDL